MNREAALYGLGAVVVAVVLTAVVMPAWYRRRALAAAVRPYADAFVVAVALLLLTRPAAVHRHRAHGRTRWLAPRHDHHAASDVATSAFTNSRLEPQP